jgi:hypothetical protein
MLQLVLETAQCSEFQDLVIGRNTHPALDSVLLDAFFSFLISVIWLIASICVTRIVAFDMAW